MKKIIMQPKKILMINLKEKDFNYDVNSIL